MHRIEESSNIAFREEINETGQLRDLFEGRAKGNGRPSDGSEAGEKNGRRIRALNSPDHLRPYVRPLKVKLKDIAFLDLSPSVDHDTETRVRQIYRRRFEKLPSTRNDKGDFTSDSSHSSLLNPVLSAETDAAVGARLKSLDRGIVGILIAFRTRKS
jgi:hypothetical protein